MSYQGLVETIDRESLKFIRAKKSAGATVAHGEDHLGAVAKLTELLGIAAGFSEREVVLARPGGWLHDFKRSPREGSNLPDEGARVAVKFLRWLERDNVFHTTRSERAAVAFAIRSHSTPPDFFTDGSSPNSWTLKKKAAAALFAADKIEANGYWVIARRSAFVGGERLLNGDLKDFSPQLTPERAVLAESAIRLTFINPQGMYPDVFAPVIAPLYDVQRDFVHGLMAKEDLDTRELAQLLLNTKDLNHKNLLNSRKGFIAPDNVGELTQYLEIAGGLDNEEVIWARVELTDASNEAVKYFSADYKAKLDDLVEKWRPVSETAQVWRKGMLDYSSGTWFEKTRYKLLFPSKHA